ncbi:exonuclease SbcCD subunit D C-terminal domain-containing protein [Daejeonella sp.]|uniref:exonuclease SbcCD subunit D n=1 Tax=Daejeonella sp. TaxID=2805397 RepID=UPI0027B8D5F9|nr:exonuclease SbcCD subunit D C-terminal domain-containing protein [Daejeonella sp.]
MALKILHTSDFHIGKQLLKVDFFEDMELFFDWLIKVIKEEKIDVLLMSGDLFDQANPSQQAMRQYYMFLKRMIPLNCKVIITGGNHDSAQVLNAPKELLEILDVTIVGGAPESIDELFFTVEKNNQKVVIAAVPYLRDRDIRQALAGETYDDKIAQIRAGLSTYFQQVSHHHKLHFSGTPLVVMAHLFAQGAETTESEREIQIGNQAGIDVNIFGANTSYVALGHIHKPQAVGRENVQYSGSPIPLSFSEKEDAKRVIVLTVENDLFNVQSINIPAFRKLITLKGTLNEALYKLSKHLSTTVLPDLIELQIIEEQESIAKIKELDELLSNAEYEGLQIVKGKIEFKHKVQGTGALLNTGEDISQFQPIDLFKKRLEQDSSLEKQDIDELLNAFREILEDNN